MPYTQMAKPIHNYLLTKAKGILLLPHQNPDPDALSSVCTFMYYLDRIGKPYTAFCGTSFKTSVDFLPNLKNIQTDPAVLEGKEFDTVCTFDAGDLKRAISTPALEAVTKNVLVINFDHHFSREHWGDMRLVDTDASSTTMVLYNYLKYNHITIDHNLSTCILTGLISDTENFTNAATRASTLQVASDLMRRGGNINLIKEELLKDKTIAGLKFWSVIFERLYHNPKHKLAVTYVKKSDAEHYTIDEDELAGVSNFIKMMKDADVVLFLKETHDGKVKGSLRTTGDFDCAGLAMQLGGGGHRKAAGFAVDGLIREHKDGYIMIEGDSEEVKKLNELIQLV